MAQDEESEYGTPLSSVLGHLLGSTNLYLFSLRVSGCHDRSECPRATKTLGRVRVRGDRPADRSRGDTDRTPLCTREEVHGCSRHRPRFLRVGAGRTHLGRPDAAGLDD